MRIDPIKPWEVSALTREIVAAGMGIFGFKHTGAWTKTEEIWVRQHARGFASTVDLDRVSKFMQINLGLESTHVGFDKQLIEFLTLLPPGAHLTAEVRIERVYVEVALGAYDKVTGHLNFDSNDVTQTVLYAIDDYDTRFKASSSPNLLERGVAPSLIDLGFGKLEKFRAFVVEWDQNKRKK